MGALVYRATPHLDAFSTASCTCRAALVPALSSILLENNLLSLDRYQRPGLTLSCVTAATH